MLSTKISPPIANLSVVAQLHALAQYEGEPAHVEGFKRTVAELKLLDTASKRHELPSSLLRRYEGSIRLNETGIERGHTPYEHLDYNDLAIYLEISGATKYTDFSDRAHRYEILDKTLKNSEVSLNLKLALAREYHDQIPVAEWLGNASNSSHIPDHLDFVSQKLEMKKGYGDRAAVRDDLFTDLIAGAVMMNQTRVDNDGSAVINGLAPSILTVASFPILHTFLHDGHHMGNNGMRKAMAAHARRLYDFDESIPDEWVLNAVR